MKKETFMVQNVKSCSCRLRKITPAEALRIMGLDEKSIIRMTHPREELQKLGYSEKEINRLLIHQNKDKDLYKQAGNSIVVDVLYYIFKELFIPKAESVSYECVA